MCVCVSVFVAVSAGVAVAFAGDVAVAVPVAVDVRVVPLQGDSPETVVAAIGRVAEGVGDTAPAVVDDGAGPWHDKQ